MWKVIRWTLGRIILLFNWLFKPPLPARDPQEQLAIDESALDLKLYQFQACPFCVKVRRELRRLGVNIETRDAARDPRHKQDLLEGGGEYKVPCLRIEESDGSPSWLYESDAIVSYLRGRFTGEVEQSAS